MTARLTQNIRTLRLKVKSEACLWLDAAAVELNQAWNSANSTSDAAARPFVGAAKWLTAYERRAGFLARARHG